MKRYLVRHGLSYANGKESPAFGSPEAGLRENGVDHARMLKEVFIELLGPKIGQVAVAVSEMVRTQETATHAGFKKQTPYGILNEYDGKIKEEAMKFAASEDYDGASRVLEHLTNNLIINAPDEGIWFAHGLVIAGLTWGKDYEEIRVGDYTQREPNRFIPYFTSIRTMEVSRT